MCRFPVVIALLMVAAPFVNAQRTGPTAPRFFPMPQGQNFPGRSFLFPVGFFADPYYSDYSSVPAAQPPVIVLQAPPTPAPTPLQPPSTMQPVLIELEGDRYVRRNTEDTSQAISVDQRIAQHARKSANASSHTLANPDLAPVVLIFRDGHREDVSEYTIADGALYARRDYYFDGSWTRTIELSSLNLPDTLKLNESRGVRFQLPTAPNEVIVRP